MVRWLVYCMASMWKELCRERNARFSSSSPVWAPQLWSKLVPTTAFEAIWPSPKTPCHPGKPITIYNCNWFKDPKRCSNSSYDFHSHIRYHKSKIGIDERRPNPASGIICDQWGTDEPTWAHILEITNNTRADTAASKNFSSSPSKMIFGLIVSQKLTLFALCSPIVKICLAVPWVHMAVSTRETHSNFRI